MHLFAYLVVLGYSIFRSSTCNAANAAAPHIIMVLADDLGWNDLSFTGAGNRMQSPNLNGLAQQGVVLDRYYTFKFCSPSRSQLLIGRWAYHLGQQTELNLNPMTGCEADWINGTATKWMCNVKCGLDTRYSMLPALLKTQGYSTHALGKWHQGFYKKAHTPTYRGFDTYTGSYTNNDHFSFADGGNVTRTAPYVFNRSNCMLKDLANSSGAEIGNAAADRINAEGYTARVYAAEAERLITAHVGADAEDVAAGARAAGDAGRAGGARATKAAAPFFLYVAFTVVHEPTEAPPESVARYNGTINDTKRRTFGGMVWELDSAVGRIHAALKAAGMWENAILWFSTDNGSPIGNGGNNAPLRGSKMTYWEGGVRAVSFITSPLLDSNAPVAATAAANTAGGKVGPDGFKRWPGLVAQPDVYVTLAMLAGVSADELHARSGPLPPDGVNIWPALVAGAASPRLEVVHNINGDRPGALLVGSMKLIVGPPNQAGRGNDGWTLPPEATSVGARSTSSSNGGGGGSGGKPCLEASCPCVATPCLFNVTADPAERNDLASSHPDLVAQLLARFAKLKKTELKLEESGLCPETTLPDGTTYNKGGLPDDSEPNGCAANLKGGHWQPWM